MKEYLLLFRGGDARTLQQSPEKWQAHMQKCGNGDGRTVVGNKKVVSDGPYMEGKEMVGGFLSCKAKSYEEAVEISKGCPILEFADGHVEIREIQQM